MTTRLPSDQFGARVKLDVGDFNRRDAQVAVDLPITDTFKTNFIGAMYQNDGFLEGLTVPWDFGAQDDTILRADLLWSRPTVFRCGSRTTMKKRGTDPKIHRMTRYDNSKIYAYNIMSDVFRPRRTPRVKRTSPPVRRWAPGSPSLATTSSRERAGHRLLRWASTYTGERAHITPTTHATDSPGGVTANPNHAPCPTRCSVPGQVGKWRRSPDCSHGGRHHGRPPLHPLTAQWGNTG